jgi:RimK family alpha-L-glutamate ligase
MRFAFIAHKPTATTLALTVPRLLGVETTWLPPVRAMVQLGPGDIALGRLDVSEDLDGVEPGLAMLGQLELRGVQILNPARTLRSAHDKLLTATALARAAVPHPRTGHLVPGAPPPELELPVVLKPRFGSWGEDVMLCRTLKELAGSIEVLRQRPWFNATGALVQELVPPRGHDLRLIVAAGRVLGAVRRVAQRGEWRTNVALGARRIPAVPPRDARELALAAAAAVGGDLVGVDLMEDDDGFVVIEVNGAAEFSQEYSLGGDIFANVVSSLAGAAVLSCESRRIADVIEDPVAVGRLG